MATTLKDWFANKETEMSSHVKIYYDKSYPRELTRFEGGKNKFCLICTETVTIEKGTMMALPTKVRVEIPRGYYAKMVLSESLVKLGAMLHRDCIIHGEDKELLVLYLSAFFQDIDIPIGCRLVNVMFTKESY